MKAVVDIMGMLVINGANSVVAMPLFVYFTGSKLVVPRNAIAIG